VTHFTVPNRCCAAVRPVDGDGGRKIPQRGFFSFPHVVYTFPRAGGPIRQALRDDRPLDG
jgi:hypothetical protein